MDTDTKKKVAPNTWALEESWRRVMDRDQEKSNTLRMVLVNLGYYVPATRDDPQCEQENANHRAALHTIVDELQPDDLYAVYLVARRLLLTADHVDVHELAAQDYRVWAAQHFDKRGRLIERKA